ncbi:MAG: hypothetical protein IKD37_02980 [Clostridia bacterium]|nr:hypothetical protein [Clostridia bacterium]
MKYLFKIMSFILVMLCFTLAIVASELNGPIIVYPDEGITVRFEENTSLSSAEMQAIADSIVHDSPIPQTYAFCWLLGHDKITETVTATHHKVDTYDPRCLLEIYLITTCSRCDYYSEEFDSSGYISCCPED